MQIRGRIFNIGKTKFKVVDDATGFVCRKNPKTIFWCELKSGNYKNYEIGDMVCFYESTIIKKLTNKKGQT